MADLRARFRSYEALPMPGTIWDDVEQRAAAGADGTMARVTRLGRGRANAAPSSQVTATRLLLALIIVGLLLAVALVALVGARPRPDRQLGVVVHPTRSATSSAPDPTATPPTRTPRPSWTVDVQSFAPDMPEVVMPPLGERFESAAYHYSIQVPEGWAASPARRRWSGDGDWDGDMADAFTGTGGWDRHRLTVVEGPVADDVDQQAWVDAHVPPPPEFERIPRGASAVHEHCVFRSMTIEEGLFPWRHVTYDGRIAWLRRGCGHANVVIFTEGRVLVMDFFAYRQPVVGVDQQRVFLETIDLD